MKLRIKAIIMVVVVLLSFNSVLCVYADTPQPYYEDSNSLNLSLFFSNGNAYCGGSIIGRTGTTSITNCDITLRNSSGTYERTWTGLSSDTVKLIFNKTAYSIPRGTYTLSVFATVHLSNAPNERVSETITRTY